MSGKAKRHREVRERSFQEVFELIDVTAKRLRQIKALVVSQAAITPAQYHLLSKLWERDRRPLAELAEALGCSRATVTGLVDTLERKGLVQREPNPRDRRSVLAQLTAEGRAMKDRTPDIDQAFAGCCSGLDGGERRRLYDLLAKLSVSLGCGPSTGSLESL